MSDEKSGDKRRQRPGSSAAGEAERQAKEARLAKALRANLARRKAQVRGREDGGAEGPGDESRGPRGDSSE